MQRFSCALKQMAQCKTVILEMQTLVCSFSETIIYMKNNMIHGSIGLYPEYMRIWLHIYTYNSMKPSPQTLVSEYHNLLVNILMGYKKALTPLLTHWSYIFLALTHWYTSQTSLAWEKSWSSTTIRWISWLINSLWPNDAIWQYRSRSTLAQVMGCCRTNVD